MGKSLLSNKNKIKISLSTISTLFFKRHIGKKGILVLKCLKQKQRTLIFKHGTFSNW